VDASDLTAQETLADARLGRVFRYSKPGQTLIGAVLEFACGEFVGFR
jgi:hypothetical protein